MGEMIGVYDAGLMNAGFFGRTNDDDGNVVGRLTALVISASGTRRYLLPDNMCDGGLVSRVSLGTPTTANCGSYVRTDALGMDVPLNERARFRIPAGATLLTAAQESSMLYSDLVTLRCPSGVSATGSTDCFLGLTIAGGMATVRWHGISVSGVAAAPKNRGTSSTTSHWHGTAYEAKILHRYNDLAIDTARYARDMQYFYDHGVKVVTQSWSITSFSTSTTSAPITIPSYESPVPGRLATVRDAVRPYYEAFLQSGTAEAEKAVHVFSAGNSETGLVRWDIDHPNLPANLPFYYSDLLGTGEQRPVVLAVVALKSDVDATSNQRPLIDGYHRCGHAAAWCLAAVGENLRGVTYLLDDPRGFEFIGFLTGTSFAAPQVAGALAILMQAFPTMGAPELAWRLLQTADSTGIYATSAIYGHGLLDLDAATNPVGPMMIRAAFGAASFPEAQSLLSAPPSFGDALHQAVRGRSLAAFDSLLAPFFVPLDDYVDPLSENPAASPFAAFVRNLARSPPLLSPYRLLGAELFGFQKPLFISHALDKPESHHIAQDSMPSLNLAGDGYALAMQWRVLEKPLQLSFFQGRPPWQSANPFLDEESRHRASSYGVMLHMGALHEISFHAGLLYEEDNLLGGRGAGAFGTEGETQNWIVGFRKAQRFGEKWEGFLSAEMGVINIQNPSTLLSFRGPIITSAFSAALARHHLFEEGDQLGVQIHQPLRVEEGDFSLSYAASRRKDGSLVPAQIEAPLSPSGREIHLNLFYLKPINKNTSLKLVANLQNERGHRRSANPHFSFFAGISGRF